jgi:signal transduction histidine kinase
MRALLFCAAALTLASPAVGAPLGGTRHVLLLYSYDRELAYNGFARVFRPALIRTSRESIDFIEVSLHVAPTARGESDEPALDEIQSLLGSVRPDLVVPIGGPAVTFTQQHQAQLFPATPVLLASVDYRFVSEGRLAPNETAVAVRHDLPQAIESILRLLPETRTVVVVVGTSTHDQFWLQEMRRAFQPFDGRLAFVWTNHWSFAELLSHCQTLPPRSVILYGLLALDANGVPQREEQTLDAIHAVANAPLFGLHSNQLGHGIVGGPLLSLDDAGRDATEIAVRLLNGEQAGTIGAVTLTSGTPTFDARELRRWNIAEGRLQPGSIIRFQEPVPLQPYVAPALTGIAILTTGMLIGLAISMAWPRRRVRQAAAAGSGSAGTEEMLSRLTGRLMKRHEDERASIARWIADDMCQKLAAMSMDLHSLGDNRNSPSGAPGASGPPPARVRELEEQVAALARESLAVSDPLYAKLQLLGLTVTGRSFAVRRCAESGVTLQFTASDMPAALPPDVALALFRVLEEAIENALAHAGTARIAVSLKGTVDALDVEIADDGSGFDPAGTGSGTGLGLIGMRERLRLVGGMLAVESRPGGGTRIRARVTSLGVPQ